MQHEKKQEDIAMHGVTAEMAMPWNGQDGK